MDGQAVRIQEEIPFGHKVALTDLADGAMVVKYGAQIGHTTQAVPSGAWLHSHNLKTNLEGLLDYQYAPAAPRQPEPGNGADTFLGYCRPGGRVGTRLGSADVIIAYMLVARKPKTGNAMMIMTVDSPVEKATLQMIAGLDGIQSAEFVTL